MKKGVSQNPFNLQGKHIVVTGGLGLLGRAFACALSARGAVVHLIDVLGAAHATTTLRKELPRKCLKRIHYYTGNVSERDALLRIRRAILKRGGEIHGLVHAAARNPKVEDGGKRSPFDLREWREGLEADATGAMLAASVFKGGMKSDASIVLIASTYGVVGPNQRIYPKGFIKPAYYSAGKGAVISLTRYLAALWGKDGIRVNALVLGGVENKQDRAFQKKYAARTPLGRMARPDEYNGTLIYLLSDASSYATGALFTVDGGYTAW